MARQLTFIDCDENRLELWLKPDRVQLVVIDSRPELEAGELRRFASVMFAAYVAPELARRLDAAQLRLREARAQAAALGGELAAALDAALAALGELAAAVAIPAPVVELPEPDHELDAEAEPEPEAEAAPVVSASSRPARTSGNGRRRYPLLKAIRGKRAEDGGALRWPWSPGASRR
ncbi:MAG TPA: hypothetical protein VK601_26980 [Kofleriaceae bacterium]|nr:hypothetical protein [Kofleriaceae bacterium]